jgi:hypothetical protein
MQVSLNFRLSAYTYWYYTGTDRHVLRHDRGVLKIDTNDWNRVSIFCICLQDGTPSFECDELVRSPC